MRPLRYMIPGLVIQFACFLLNLGLGIFNWHHGYRRVAWMSFGFAALIATLTIRNLISQFAVRRLENRIFQLQLEANQIMMGGIAMAYTQEAYNMARENFMKVCKAVGAEDYNAEAPYIRIRPSKSRHFLITFGAVQELNNEGTHSVSSTCWQNQYAIPPLEAVAGVALLLQNKPQLFEYWRDHHGYSAS